MRRIGKGCRGLLCFILAFVSISLQSLTINSVSLASEDSQPALTGSAVLSGTVGRVNGDSNPLTGVLSAFGTTGSFSLDSGLNSIGADLGSAQAFNTIELYAANNKSRVEKADLTLYISPDNVSYTKVADWDFRKLGNTLILYNISASARYVKVHSHFDDTNAEFAGPNLQNMLKVSNEPPGRWTANGGSGWLYRKPVTVSNPNNQTIYDRAVYLGKASLGVSALIAAGKMQADYRDVRFAGADGRELPFYMDGSGFYVRMPELQALASKTIYLYYGNSSAAFAGGGQEALQVEYGSKTLVNQGTSTFGANIKPVRLKDGTLMLMAQTDKTTGIYARFSSDDGRTWTAPEPLISPGGRAGVSLDSPGGAYVDPATGEVHVLFYSYYYFGVWDGVNSCLNPSVCRSDMFYVKSTGFSGHKPVFGTPVPITGMVSSLGNPVNYAVTYTNPIRLSTGRLAVTFGFVLGNDGTFGAGVAYSDDNGATWTKSASDLTIPSSGGEGGVSETAMVELADGSLKIYARQQRGDNTVLGVSVSTDHGATWSPIQDSDILSSNTFPAMSRASDGNILLNWSGHNAMGASSYYRNNLTVAYSDDETLTWKGYRDLFGRTRLSAPGWYSNADRLAAVESDKVPSGEDAYLFSWSGGGVTGSLRVEDFSRYLYRSHGALDDFEYEKSGTVNGSGMANDYWWQTTSAGSVATSGTQAKQGGRSLRIYDNLDNTAITAASRLFPGTSKGSVRFSLYGQSFGNSLYMSLQEGFSNHWNATGTAFTLQVAPDGSLKYSNASTPHNRRAGFLTDDTSPASGNLVDFGNTGLFAFDYKSRSLGLDLGRVERLKQIKLFDNDASNRIAASNLSVYVSNTNQGDWLPVTGWTFSKSNGTVTIGGLSVNTRYVKVHQNFTDTSYTLVNGLQDMIDAETAEPSRLIGYLTDDVNPAAGNLGNFGYTGGFGFDYKKRSIGTDLGAVETVKEIKLWDTDSTSRLTSSDLSVYVSDKNAGDWVPVSGWTFGKTDGTITIGGLSVQARYVKVHQNYNDTSFTFGNETQDLMTVKTLEHGQTTGFLTNDTSPAAGNLGDFGYTGLFGFDYKDRSIGVDLGKTETIYEIKLHDNDSATRLTASDLSVYASQTNTGDWVPVTGWTYAKTNGTITIGGLSVNARYVKVHQSFADTSFTFVNETKNLMTVKTLPLASSLFQSLPTATTLPLQQWNEIRLDFALDTASAAVYVNGAYKGQIPAAHPGPIVTHFMISSGAGSGTDVYMDEFMLQEMSVSLPAAGAVGAEEAG